MEYTISNDKISLKVSSYGAQMQSVQKDGVEYLWQGDKNFWGGKAPNLFPFVGRLTEGKYRYKGQCYDMDIHGFARDAEFTLQEHTENCLKFLLTDSDRTFRIYPFHFQLVISYTLEGQTIRIGYRVLNTSEETMYFGIGGHPGFNVPLEEGLQFEDYYLEFGEIHQPDRVGHTGTCFLNGSNKPFALSDGNKMQLRHSMFDEDAIVLQNVADAVTLKTDKGTRSVKVTYPDLPFLGIWHAPKKTAPYICIEPWTSLPSRQDIIEDFEFKNDLVRLHKDKVYETVWSISLE